MRQNTGRQAQAGVPQAQLAVFASDRQDDLQPAFMHRYLVERLQGVHEQVVDDLLQRHRLGPDAKRRSVEFQVGLDGVPAQLGLQQMQCLARHELQVDVLHLCAPVRLFDRMAQAVHHIERALGLVYRLLDGELCDGQIGRVLVQHPVGGLGVGQHRGKRLIQFMRHAGGQFAQRIEARHLSKPQQLFGPAPVGALAQQGARGQQQHGHQQAPAQHQAPGQFAPTHVPLRCQVERLAVGGQRFVKFEAPTGGVVVARGTRLYDKALAAVFKRHVYRACVRRHRPLIPGHHAAHVDEERVTDRVRTHHDLVTAFGKIHIGQHRAVQAARLGLRRQQGSG